MSVLANRVKVAVDGTPGTGTINLGSAIAGYQSFADGGITNGQVVSYAIEDGSDWEIGTGTYTTGTPDTLSRTVIESSNSDAALDLSSSAVVFVTALASELVLTTNTQTLTNKTLTSPTVTGAVLNDGYTEEVFDVTGTTPALSPTNGSIQTWTLSGASTPTAGTWAAGQSLTLLVDDGTDYTITWTSLAVTWKTDGGSAPALNQTGFTVIQLWKVGSTIYGARVGDA